MLVEEVKQLKHGEYVYELNSPHRRWKVTGKVKLWKRNPERVSVSIKHGLYLHGYITEENCHVVSTARLQGNERSG